jgi:hypothetical protein
MPHHLTGRVDRLFRALGDGLLWDGENMESLAKARVFTPSDNKNGSSGGRAR